MTGIRLNVSPDVLDQIHKLANRSRRMMVLLDCPCCGTTNRIPQGKRTRCGSCAHEFTPKDLVGSRVEPPPAPPEDIDLGDEDLNDAGNVGPDEDD